MMGVAWKRRRMNAQKSGKKEQERIYRHGIIVMR